MKVGYLVYYPTTYLYEVHQIIKSFQHPILGYHLLRLLQMVTDVECALCEKRISSIFLIVFRKEFIHASIPHKYIRL